MFEGKTSKVHGIKRNEHDFAGSIVTDTVTLYSRFVFSGTHLM